MKTMLAVVLSVSFLAGEALALTDSELARMGLIPKPKKFAVGGEARLRPPVMLNGVQSFPGCAAWLREIVERQIGAALKSESSKTGCRVELIKAKQTRGPEAFRIDIADGHVRLTAETEPGMFRALGRLARILDSAACDRRDGLLVCPALRIDDWPDMSIRGMDLQMAYRPNETLARDTVEVMARLGFNLVGYEVGARYEYQSHPECRQPGRCWKRDEVRRLVALAKARGITPIPCLNAIGHADRAPLVCTLPDKRWQYRVMDLTDPKFYPTFFDLLDELVEVFDCPPYVHLGTDECREALTRLAKLRSRTPQSLYAEFVNRVSAHLAKLGVKAIIWSDMLLRREAFSGEPSNASAECPTDLALDALGKDVVIDYWCYSPSDYRGLELFRNKKFKVWVSPWYNAEGVARLCWKGHELGAAAVFGTTWTDASRVPHGMVLTAEYAWNAAQKGRRLEVSPMAVGNELYCGRGKWGPANAQPFAFKGGANLPPDVARSMKSAGLPIGAALRARGLTFDLSQARYFGSKPPRVIGKPEEILKAAAAGERLFVSLGPGKCYPVNGVNTARGTAQTILYVRDGVRTTTKTNRWGGEWVVRNGRVTAFFPPKRDSGNATIPTDGYVISAHGFPSPSGYAFLRRNLREGGRVEILAFVPPKKELEATANFQQPRRGIAVLLTAVWPIPEKSDLLTMEVVTVSGKRLKVSAKGSVSLPALHQLRWHYSPRRGNGWRIWPAWFQYDARNPTTVLAYEWNAPDAGDPARALRIVVQRDGRLYGVAVLAGAGW